MDINKLVTLPAEGNQEAEEGTSSPSIASKLSTESADLLNLYKETGTVSTTRKATHMETLAKGGMNTLKGIDRVFGTEESQANMQQLLAEQPEDRYLSSADVDWTSISDIAGFSLQEMELQAANLMAVITAGGTGAALGSPALGLGAGLFPMHAGEALQASDEAGGVKKKDGTTRRATTGDVVVPAAINSAMDAASLKKIASLMGIGKYLKMEPKVNNQIAKSFGKRFAGGAKDVAMGTGIEVATEVAQENINGVWAELLMDKDFRTALTDGLQNGDEVLDTMLRTLVSAGPVIAAGRVLTPQDEGNKLPKDKPPVEEEPPVSEPPEDTNPISEEEPPVEREPTVEEEPHIEEEPIPQTVEEAEVYQVVQTLQGKAAYPKPKYTVKDLTGEVSEAEITEDFGALVDEVNELAEGLNDPQFFGLGSLLSQHMDRSVKTFATAKAVYSPIRRDANGEVINQTVKGHLYKGADGKKNYTVNEIMQSPTYGVFTDMGEGSPNMGGYKFSDTLIEELTQAIELVRSQLLPDTNILLQYGSNKVGTLTRGSHTGIGNPGEGFSVINLNPQSNSFRELQETHGLDSVEYKDKVKQVAMHEMAHAIVTHEVRHMPVAVRKKMISTYLKYLKDIKDGKMLYKDFLKIRKSSNEVMSSVMASSPDVLDTPMIDLISEGRFGNTLTYTLSFEEFFAEKIADEIARSEVVGKSNIKGFFASLAQKLKNFLRLNFKPDQVDVIYREVLDKLTKYHRVLKNAESQGIRDEIQPIMDKLLGVSEVVELPPHKYWHQNYDRYVNADEELSTELKDQEIQFQKQYHINTGFNKIAQILLSPNQLAKRYNIKPALDYMEEVRKFWATKMAGIGQADEIAREWMALSDVAGDQLGAYLFDLSVESQERKRKLLPTEKRILQQQHNLTPKMIELAGRIEESFTEVLSRTKYASQKDAARVFLFSPDEFLEGYNRKMTAEQRMQYVLTWVAEDQTMATNLLTELGKIERQYAELEGRNYFPRMRFGKHLIVQKERQEDGSTKVVSFEAYETAKERDKALHTVMKLTDDNENLIVQGRDMDDIAATLWGMPQMVVDKITNDLKKAGSLTDTQRDVLQAVALELSPGRRHMKQMKRRKNVVGYSKDAMRTYASYMSNASNHLARVEHTNDLLDNLKAIQEMTRGKEGNLSDLDQIHAYYRGHFKYIMNPENDWAQLRNAGFLWYLGFNPKSALINLSQLPMVTYPWLASKVGDGKAIGALTKASKDISLHLAKRKQLTAGEQALLDQLTKEGIIDESFAMELSALANTNLLTRMTKKKGFSKRFAQFNQAAGYMFSSMEKFNRRVNSLAAYRVGVKDMGLTHKEAVKFARDSVMETQFEYAKWDRATFMRGKKSAAFLFMNYTQSFLFTAFNGKNDRAGRQTAIRMWIVLGLMAGLQGLPGAEYLLTMFDMGWTALGRLAGWENPKVDSRKFLREYLAESTNPEAADLFLHGTSRYGFGSGLLMEKVFNTPFSVDLSGSLSMGAPLQFGRTTTRDGYQMGDFLLEATGALGSAANGIWQAATSNDPDEWKRIEKALPVAAKNLSKGIRYEVRGEETFKGGAQFMDMRDQTALNVMQMLGFSGTSINQRREMFGEQMQASLYWNSRRKWYLDEYALADEWGDKERKKELVTMMNEFNQTLTDKALRKFRISSKDRRTSLNLRKKTNRKKEEMKATRKREKLLFDAIEKNYPDFNQ